MFVFSVASMVLTSRLQLYNTDRPTYVNLIDKELINFFLNI